MTKIRTALAAIIAALSIMCSVLILCTYKTNAQAADSVDEVIAEQAGQGNTLISLGLGKDRIEISEINGCAPSAGHSGQHENSLEIWGWFQAQLTDGKLASGWSSCELSNKPDITITYDLSRKFNVAQVSLFRVPDESANMFPDGFTVQTSENKTDWNDFGGESAPDRNESVHNITAQNGVTVVARYVRICMQYTSSHCQLAEIAVYGNADGLKGELEINKPALELETGDTEQLTAQLVGGGGKLTWESSDSTVATVSQDGTVTAVGEGVADITVHCADTIAPITAKIYVVDKKKGFDDNILISVFYPHEGAYINGGNGDERWEEQYDLLAAAHIDFLNNALNGAGLTDKESNLKMARYAYERGLRIGVADERFGAALLGKSETYVYDLINEYRNIPGVSGYYILDEPINPNVYADAYAYIKKADSSGYAHLNFLPYTSYADSVQYESQMNDWVKLTAARGYAQDYLMYDLYPFGDNTTGMNRKMFYDNMDVCRRVGLENGVKTAMYLQSMRIPNVYRCPTMEEIRYEAMAAMAYGYKQLSYFTWFTPGSQHSETFESGIILPDGTPNPKTYEGVKQLNSEIHALGATLIHLDAKEVYLNGSLWGQKAIPDRFFAQAVDSVNYTISYLRDKNTGRNYMMLVNNDYSASADIKVKLDDKISGLLRISATDGTATAVTLESGNLLSVKLAAGDGALYVLDESFDYETDYTPTMGENLALRAVIGANTSIGSDNLYIDKLNDGIRATDASRNSLGWRAQYGVNAFVSFDFGKPLAFNRMDLYPYGDDLVRYGVGFAAGFTIEVSDDGVDYRTVKTYSDFAIDGITPPVLCFDSVTARYVRLTFTDCPDGYAALAEIEIYCDDGSVPAAECPLTEEDGAPVEWKEGVSIAHGKQAFVSSSVPDYYAQWGWAIGFANDGVLTNGWSSNVGVNTSETAREWYVTDFGDVFDVNLVRVYNHNKAAAFPVDYKIQLSLDAHTWVDIADVKNDDAHKGWREFEIQNSVRARFVRVYGTKLRVSGSDGYIMQLYEVEAFGTPVIDKSIADAFVARIEQLADLLDGENTPYTDKLRTELAGDTLTQSGLKALIKQAEEEIDVLLDVDTAAAESLLAQIEDLNAVLAKKDTALLDAAVAELRATLNSPHTQRKIDGLTAKVTEQLDKTLSAPNKPVSEPSQDPKEKGCGASASHNCGAVAVVLMTIAITCSLGFTKKKS